MSRKTKITLIILGVFLMVFSLNTYAQAAKTSYTFILIPKGVNPWYKDVMDGGDQAVKELAARGVTIKTIWDPPPQADVVLHTQRIEQAIVKKPDALAVSSLDPTANTPVINEAIKKGIPTICFDNDAPDSDRLFFVDHPDNEPDGIAMAALLAKVIGEKGDVAVMLGSLGSIQHRQRVVGIKKQLEKYPGIKIVNEFADNDDMEAAYRVAADCIKTYPNLKGFVCADAPSPVAAARAVEAANKIGQLFVVGTDDLPDMVRYMRKGIVSGMNILNAYEQGYWSVYLMWAYLNGHTVPKVYDTGSTLVTTAMLPKYHKYDAAQYQVK